MQTKNSYTVQITGLSELPLPLVVGNDYELAITGGCYAETKEDNNDGSYTYKFKIRQVAGEIKNDKGQTIKVTDKKSHSKKFRQQLGFIAKDRGTDEQEFYEKVMIDLRHYTYEVLDFLEGIKK